METELIIKSVLGLIALLSLLVFLLFLEPNKDKKQANGTAEANKEKNKAHGEETNLRVLVDIVKNKKSDAKKLSYALDMIIKHHGVVHRKMGLSLHKDFDTYMGILFALCRHPNANKDLIINFDKELTRLNPDYKQDINNAISKGLASRGM